MCPYKAWNLDDLVALSGSDKEIVYSPYFEISDAPGEYSPAGAYVSPGWELSITDNQEWSIYLILSLETWDTTHLLDVVSLSLLESVGTPGSPTISTPFSSGLLCYLYDFTRFRFKLEQSNTVGPSGGVNWSATPLDQTFRRLYLY
jgi:hypothetical protein